MFDSGVYANTVWNAAHGYGLLSSVFADKSYLGVHFAFTAVLFAPLVRLWESTACLALAHGLIVGTVPLAAFLLARRLTGRPLMGWIFALLACSHPFFHDNLGSVLDNSLFALPCFIWAAYFWETRRPVAAALLAAVMASTREQVPFLFFGLALYAYVRADARRAKRIALAAMLGAVLLWLGEMAVIGHYQKELAQTWNFWHIFPQLGGSRERVLETALTRPWLFAAALVYPPQKLWIAGRILLTFAALPLFSGAAILAVLPVWGPHLLAAAGSSFNELKGHHSAIAFGPLLWISAIGLKNALSRLPKSRHALLAAGILTVSGCCFLTSADFLLPPGMMPRSWKRTVPRALEHIPARAKVWCDPLFLPQLAMRRHVKALPFSEDFNFESGLFVPDRVLLSVYWKKRVPPAYLSRIMAPLEERGFKALFQEQDIVVLAPPGPARTSGEAEPLRL